MKFFKKWWIWLLLLLVLFVLYFILGRLAIIPTYQCGGSLGEDGSSYNWCEWSYGEIVG